MTQPISSEENYQHTPLANHDNIRLFTLYPAGSLDDPVHGDLTVHSLKSPPEYEGLSYACGDVSVKVPVFVGDKPLGVGRNLLTALRWLRDKDSNRVLWIDALCIHQQDIEEKSRQVGMMRYIYQKAQQTVIWVGEESENSKIVFQYATTMMSDTDVDVDVDSPYDPEEFKPFFTALRRFSMREYFERTWVIQEVVLAQQAYIVCGPDVASFKSFVSPGPELEPLYQPLIGVLSPQERLRVLTDLGLQGSPVGLPGYTANQLLGYSRFCAATDPRDKVYALQGMFEEDLVPTDYARPIADIYRDFTHAIIQARKNLEILHMFGVRHEIQGLGSWVPDYSISRPIAVLPKFINQTYKASFHSTILKHSDTASNLVILGKPVDRITSIGLELLVKQSHHRDSPQFHHIITQWTNLAQTLEQKSRPFASNLDAAYAQTLIAEDFETEKAGYFWRPTWLPDGAALWLQRHAPDLAITGKSQGIARNITDDMELNYFSDSMELACYGRRFFVSEAGSMGLAPCTARLGDEIVCFPGGLYPFVARRRNDGSFILLGDCFLYGYRQEIRAADEDVLVEYILR